MADLSQAERTEIIVHIFDDPVWWCREFLPHWFPGEIPWLHRGILAILTRQCAFLVPYGELEEIMENFLDKDGNPIFYWADGEFCMTIAPFTQVRMPRGFSKTTLCNAVMLRMIVLCLFLFPVYVSETATHAETQLNTIKREIETNQKLIAVFGVLKPAMHQGMWRHDEIDLLNGVHVVAKGRGSQIRGLNVNAQRPDAILLDDVEDRESVQTEEQREKTRKWFYNDVLPALPTGRTDCPVWILGTLLHSEALLVTIEKDPRFTVLKFSTRKRGSDEIGSLWPFVQKSVQLAFYSAAQVDQLASYYMEYEGEIRNEATAIFKERYFKWGDPPEGEPVTYAVAMDPAISEKKTADFAVVIAVALSLRNGYIYVLKSWGRRGPTPYDLLAKFFEFVKGCPDGTYGIEAIAYQASLIHIARTEMFRTGQYFEITPITHSSGPHKVARIKGILQPRYAAGMVYHSGRHLELESQLKTFDEKLTSKVDFPDALAMAVALLDPYAAAAADPEKDLGAPEYEPLELQYAV